MTTPTVSGLSVTPTNATLFAGATRQLTAQVIADPGASNAVTWTSSTPNVASVSATGVVTALALGSATITVRSVLVPSVSASATITVGTPPPLTQWTASSLGAEGGVSYRGMVHDLWATPTGHARLSLAQSYFSTRHDR